MKGMLKKTYSCEIKDIDEEERSLVAYASTEDEDRDGDVLLASGAALDNYRKNPVVLWAHNYRMPPIAKAMWTKADERGLLFKPQFARTALAEEVFYLYREGFLKAFSVGFIPGEWDKRTLKSWELLEVSAVPVPANPEALVTELKEGRIKSEILVKEFGQEGGLVDPEEDWWSELKNYFYIEGVAVAALEKDSEHAENGEESVDEKIEALASRHFALEEKVGVLAQELKDKGAASSAPTKEDDEGEANEKEDDILSEISAEEVASLTAEVIRGEIRKVMGKVD